MIDEEKRVYLCVSMEGMLRTTRMVPLNYTKSDWKLLSPRKRKDLIKRKTTQIVKTRIVMR